MKYCKIALIVVITIFNTPLITAQSFDKSQITKVNVDDLSDEQIQSYWNRAKEEGYSIDQLEVIAKSNGMSSLQFSKLKQRIQSLKFSDPNVNTSVSVSSSEVSNIEKFGLEGKASTELKKSPLYGYDFFSNPNISFTPNLNLAAPANYQLGPGDELLIDIWGAAQNNYRKKIDREGAIKIENIGPVYISGLTYEKAKEKIISYLKKIYGGLGAPTGSYAKVYADVTVVGVRTVQVNVIGEVKVPGTYSLSALSTVLNALYAAGGPTEKGTFRTIKVIRGGKQLSEFDIYKYLLEGSEKGNELLRDQDIIIIAPYISMVTVEGNVKRPGLYELKAGETIQDLVQYFGGFTASAYQERLLVERVNGKQKEVSEIVWKDQPDFKLNDGDLLKVGTVIDRYENRVQITGAVYRPGDYELTNDLTLYQLIERAAGLKDIAFLERGLIHRTIDDVNKEIISFSLQKIMEKKESIILKREDRIQIFNKNDLKENYTLTINGAVNKPLTVDFAEKMRIEDLVALAGGFSEGADVEIVDVFRRVSDDYYTTISKNIRRTSSPSLHSDDAFYLEPFDRIVVRHKKGYVAERTVTISGEVLYGGNYALIKKEERISDVIQRAGGFSPFAYLKGATIIRKVNRKSQDIQSNTFQHLIDNDGLGLSDENTTRIGINLEEIMKPRGLKSKIDLFLEDGDIISVPSEKQTVEVRGEVMAPSFIRFEKNKSLKEYINNSGGYSDNAKRNNSYVIYANGDIKSTKNFLFFKFSPKIEPGALVVVPNKPESKDKMSLQEILGITTALSTIGVLINTFVK